MPGTGALPRRLLPHSLPWAGADGGQVLPFQKQNTKTGGSSNPKPKPTLGAENAFLLCFATAAELPA